MISQDQQEVEVLLPAGLVPLPEQVHQLRGNGGSRPGDQMDLRSRSHSKAYRQTGARDEMVKRPAPPA